MIQNKSKRILSALVTAGAMVLMTVPVSADVLTPTNPTGTIAVYANVTSDYEIKLPASIEMGECDSRGDTDNHDLYFTAQTQVGVKGTLLGEKVTLVPTGDTNPDGKYSFQMDAATFDGSGNPTIITGSEAEFLTVTVDQPNKVWIPDQNTLTTGTGEQKIASDEFIMSDVTLLTTSQATVGKAYSGNLTFTVACDTY